MKSLELLPGPVTKKIFNKSSLVYTPSRIWNIFDDLTNGSSLTQSQTDELFDFLLSIGILVIRDIYPGNPVKYNENEGFIANDQQIDEMMDVVIKLYDYFVSDPSRVTSPKYYPQSPQTVVEERKFHNHFKNKGKNLWKDGYKKRQNEPLSRRLGQANEFFGEGESAEQRRTDVHTEAMTETPDFLFMKTPSGFSLDLYKSCASEKVFNEVSEKAKDTINNIYVSEHIRRMLSKVQSKNVTGIIKSILKSKGFKILEQNDTETSFIIDGPKGSIISNNFEEGKTSQRTVILNSEKPTEKNWEDSIALRKLQKTQSLLFISTQPETTELADARKKSKGVSYETWDLLDLVDIIKKDFDKLPESDQQRIQSLIEELVTDF